MLEIVCEKCSQGSQATTVFKRLLYNPIVTKLLPTPEITAIKELPGVRTNQKAGKKAGKKWRKQRNPCSTPTPSDELSHRAHWNLLPDLPCASQFGLQNDHQLRYRPKMRHIPLLRLLRPALVLHRYSKQAAESRIQRLPRQPQSSMYILNTIFRNDTPSFF